MRTAVQGYATFNDDIQATAAVTLGSLYGAQRQAGVPSLADQTFLFFGAGQANIGAAQLLTLALARNGLSAAEARSRIWLIDSQVKPCTLPQHDMTRSFSVTGAAVDWSSRCFCMHPHIQNHFEAKDATCLGVQPDGCC